MKITFISEGTLNKIWYNLNIKAKTCKYSFLIDK